MALATTAAAVAGGSAAAAYLDAKFHFSKDLDMIRRVAYGRKSYAKALKEDRIALWNLFAEAAAKYPDATCLWSRTGIYTWKQTRDQACRYAQYFLSLGVQSGQLVAFYLMNSPEFMFAWLGLWAIGCAPAMINYNLAGEALMHCAKISGAHVLIVDADEGCQARIAESREKIEGELGIAISILTDETRGQINSIPAEVPDEKYRKGMKGEFPMALIYTSGTTGLPKGCAFCVDRIWLIGAQRGNHFNQKAGPGGDRWYDCMPMYHGTGGVSAMSCMIGGISLAIGKRFSVSNFWRDVHDSESTFFIYVGETARYLLAAPPTKFDKDHKVRCMYGNGLRPDVWDRFRERFNVPEVAEFFNSTEGIFSLINWDRGDYFAACVGHHGLLLRTLFKNIYVPVMIDHETSDIWRDPKKGFAKRTPYAEGGEMIVKVQSEKDFQGYWRSPAATEKKFVRNVFKKGDLYYRSGDALRRTDDGRWFFMDRLGDTFRWKSENVSTAEVAEVLGRFPGVVEANVYGVLVPNHDGRAGCAALLVEEDKQTSFDYEGFLKHARQSLPRYAVPIFLRVVAASHKIHNNKQNKVPLRKEGVDPDLLGEGGAGGEGGSVDVVDAEGEYL